MFSLFDPHFISSSFSLQKYQIFFHYNQKNIPPFFLFYSFSHSLSLTFSLLNLFVKYIMTYLKHPIILFLIVLLSFLLFPASTQTTPQFKLTYFIKPQCRYCNFMANQLKQLIQQMVWEQKLQYQIIDCSQQITKNACVDNYKSPYLKLISNEQDNKQLGRLGGIHSYYFYRDWISDLITAKYPEEELKIIEGYNVSAISYRRELLQDHEELLRRKMKLLNKKNSMMKSVEQELEAEARQLEKQQTIVQQIPKQEPEKAQEVTENQVTSRIEEEKERDRFHGIGTLGYLALAVPAVFYVIVKALKSRNQQQAIKNQQRVRIPEEDINDFD